MKKIIFISMIFLGISALLISCSDDNIPPVDIPGIYDETMSSVLVGYCRNNYSLALGTETESLMGAAIKMDTILAGKGSQIIAVRIGLSTEAAGLSGELCISKRLKSKPLYSQEFVAQGTGWEYIKLDSPYELNEKDTLYISYTLTGKGQLIGYQNTGIKNSSSDMVMMDRQWLHLTSASITGQVCIQAVIAGNEKLPLSYDLSLGTMEYARYVQSGEENPLSVVVTNYGSAILNGCVLTFIDGADKKEITISDKLPNGRPVKTVLQLPDREEGVRNFTIKVRPVDASVKELSMANNELSGVQDIYGKSFERTLLLEQFTGQGCMYCPSGEENLSKVVGENRSRVAWVAHHVGFGNDLMTIPVSSNYIRFYNSESTYAPAVMMNRTSLSWKGILQPVFSSFDLTEEDIKQLLTEPAHVSVNLDMNYEPQTRALKITVKGTFLMKDVSSRLTLFLVQDGIVGYQENGGKQYEHKAVIRACLSDAWGDALMADEDGMFEKEYDYIIPEKIGTFDCDVNKMYIVAFVADYNPDDINDCKVLNAAFKYIK